MPLAGGRHLCFGRFGPEDRWCLLCPRWLREKCVATTPGASGETKTWDARLDQLQKSISGVT